MAGARGAAAGGAARGRPAAWRPCRGVALHRRCNRSAGKGGQVSAGLVTVLRRLCPKTKGGAGRPTGWQHRVALLTASSDEKLSDTCSCCARNIEDSAYGPGIVLGKHSCPA